MFLPDTLPTSRPAFSGKDRRRPSTQLLLPPLVGTRSGTPTRWAKVAFAVTAAYCCWTLTSWTTSTVNSPFNALVLRRNSCEGRGFVSPTSGDNDEHRLVVRLQPTAGDDARPLNTDNTILPQAFHPTLSGERRRLFDGTSLPHTSPTQGGCLDPVVHSLPIDPRPLPSADDPELFFSLCTSPDRAISHAPVWRHFMSVPTAPDGSSLQVDPSSGRAFKPDAPGCIVTDAVGQIDVEGWGRANAAFAEQELACRMKDSGRVGERYEMRVLGLVRDAWLESERRRWQDGAPMVEWFIFGDDDTWWSDPQMLRAMLKGYDWREDHMLGSFSETRGNFEWFGKIAFGGAGTIMSRSLVRKMQSTLDECAVRFADTFGGDGLMSKCAAWTRGIPLEQLVEEVPAMRQMDIRGDATGYLTAGTAPFLSLHHWASWLRLFPTLDGLPSIQLLSSAASALGGPNFLRRWVFDDGTVSLTLGYAITVHREPLSGDDLRRIEWTWDEHEPRKEARPALREGEQKLTYYLSSVERLSPDVALLKHTCTSPLVESGLREIDILWDVRAESASWLARLVAGLRGHTRDVGAGHGRGGARARPSPKAGAEEEVAREEGVDEFKREKAKREVKFEG
ncbi:hypothetical protein JCM10207_007408 [Rhodosporidiobolus poonsookiae]